ncbi:MAG: GNAT family N-acetyltransferase [Mycobacteriales bacterium]
MQIRVAGAEDALAVETVRIGSWKVAYRGMVPDAFLDGLVVDAERRAAQMAAEGLTVLLATEDDQPVGMAAHGPCRDDDRSGEPELYALYVLPPAWRTGVGAALLAACGDVASLWVLEANARARGFYARHRFRPDGVSKALDLGGAVVEVRMVRP